MTTEAAVQGAIVTTWMRDVAEAMRAESAHLTQLDAAIGDGDHGVNMERGFSAVEKALAGQNPDVPPGRYDLQVFHASVSPDALLALRREITVTSGDTSLGNFALVESDVLAGHKNKYGHDYDRPDPDSPAYARP